MEQINFLSTGGPFSFEDKERMLYIGMYCNTDAVLLFPLQQQKLDDALLHNERGSLSNLNPTQSLYLIVVTNFE